MKSFLEQFGIFFGCYIISFGGILLLINEFGGTIVDNETYLAVAGIAVLIALFVRFFPRILEVFTETI